MRSTESGFSEIVYIEACRERMNRAAQLMNDSVPDYVLATYLSGVAVECLFHAYRLRAGTTDGAKHDLGRQSQLGDFYNGMKREQKEAVTALLDEIVARWQNNYRYRSGESMKGYVLAKRLYIVGKNNTATRDDVVKHNAEMIVDAAIELTDVGLTRWILLQPT